MLLVSRGNEILDFREEDTSGSHGNILPQLLQQIIGEKGFRWKDFCALSLMNGPGSYTGLRVASAFAKAVGFVHHLPLILHNALDYAYRSIGDRSAVYIKHARADEYFGLDRKSVV